MKPLARQGNRMIGKGALLWFYGIGSCVVVAVHPDGTIDVAQLRPDDHIDGPGLTGRYFRVSGLFRAKLAKEQECPRNRNHVLIPSRS